MFDDMFFAGFEKPHTQKEAPPVYMSNDAEDMSNTASTPSQEPERIDTDDNNKQTYRQQDMSPLTVDTTPAYVSHCTGLELTFPPLVPPTSPPSSPLPLVLPLVPSH